ncbi:redox-sensitive transcriptional activator SoxR [Roseovarius nubinhibens]|uniref:redox-sensitive transcriptional activator SoxR n=1 Tax=Roseovarius nubinhibens TaxID=314263 RepID=UPI001C082582|nr:redox-sensitive transcriptional activator SoxR [Roseovarius nubinhibens]MBU2999976.1 redox-sensitive transcriptional activator SoxR [Roseovarius nubinhibens]
MKTNNLSNSALSIGSISARTGLAPSAIRYYEDEGLIAPGRNASGHRRYARSDIRRLSFVQISQGLGFTIAEIREALSSLPADRAPTKADWSRISRRFGAELDARIARMQLLRTKLDSCIGCGCLSLKTCALYNPRDRAKRLGSGPRYLLGDTPPDRSSAQK